ncbi:hypothetical protein GCM10008090_12140 [Arenicella chitinivorans]|uniref:Uncharacterized protein n=1 Tax=Arenicella chitinivorans TaxID=1329800 RepID=A0A918VJM6_9GAMM|nr:hypothetical protein [Arenicella chitinivorans]GHA04361.1 hypothetical protein GCM10008090_12140 [Arenicella chitinivorans]
MYRFSESARSKGGKIGFIGLVIVAICISFLILIWHVPAKGPVEVLYLVLLVIALLPGLLMLFTGVLQIVRGGEFDVQVTNVQLQWMVPDYLGECFTLAIDEIDHVEKRTRIKRSGKVKSSYCVVCSDGTRYRLGRQSGVPIDAVVGALVQVGIQVRDVNQST